MLFTKKLREKHLYMLFTALYVLYLIPFYTKPYYPPDTFYYAIMFDKATSQGMLAYDGFSSLFLVISRAMGQTSFAVGIILILIMNAFSIYVILTVLGFRLASIQSKILFAVFVLSNGCFFYVYGKLLYEWPFTMLNTAVCLWLLDAHMRTQKKTTIILFWSMLGLLLSWKPSNIFIVTAFFAWIILQSQINALYYKNIKKGGMGEYCKNLVIAGGLCICGYLFGNFGLLIMPVGTLKGISAYPASSNFFNYLFFNRQIWDHVNMMGFNVSVLNIISLFLILFCVPLLLKRWGTFLFSAFMSTMFFVFITNFSAGYPWHGFPFAAVVIFLLWHLLHYGGQKPGKVVSSILVFSVILQAVICHLYFVPLQRQLNTKTEEAYYILKSEGNHILMDISDMIDTLDGTYAVELALKWDESPKGNRQSVLPTTNSLYAKAFLAEQSRSAWDATADYYLYVFPKPFGYVDIVNRPLLLNYSDELIRVIDRTNYTISLYKNRKFHERVTN